MKVLLVFPPLLGKERYGKLAKGGSYLPPLGLAYLAAAIEKEHEVKIIDGSVLNISIDDICKEVEEWKADVVGITTYTSTYYRSIATCEKIKETNSKVTTILGGPHATACPMDCIKEKSVDIVVLEEGESTFKELMKILEKNGDISTVKGIFYKRDGEILTTGLRDRIDYLDSLPFPARHLLPMKLYKPSALHYKKLPALAIICGRGCPSRCTFCACSKVFRRAVVIRSPENIIAEIKFLIEEYGAKEIMFWDDTFGLSRNWLLKLCELMKQEDLDILWSCWSRPGKFDKELLKIMADAGCWNISYGVESGNQLILNTIKKGFLLEQVRKSFKWTHEAGMEARATFILGLPNETWETMMQTIDFAIEIDADYAQFQLLTPYPGTELWDTASQYGYFQTKDLSKYTIWNPVFVPNGLTKKQLEEAHRLAYKKFYLRPRYWINRLRNIRNFQDLKRYFIGFNALFDFLGNKKG